MGGNALAELQQPGVELIGGRDLRYEASAQRLVRVDEAGLEEEPERGLMANNGRQ